MSEKLTAQATLEREFLPVRAKILEIAAALDRIDRVAGSQAEHPRVKQLTSALAMVLEDRADRAERVQLLFSRPYDEQWQSTLEIVNR